MIFVCCISTSVTLGTASHKHDYLKAVTIIPAERVFHNCLPKDKSHPRGKRRYKVDDYARGVGGRLSWGQGV